MDILEKILQVKRDEVNNMPEFEQIQRKTRSSFYEKVKAQPEVVHVIGEIKRASPSKGTINSAVDIKFQAKEYERGGVSAISVLTDEAFFKGSLADLSIVAKEVAIPILCKDFIISEKQLIRAKNAGASIVLLIVAALSFETLRELHAKALAMGLEVLVETHNLLEMQRAKEIGAKLIGVNNRDLKSFVVDIQQSVSLAQPEDETVYISESGFVTGSDVQQVAQHYQAVLVGETLMTADNLKTKIQELRVKRYD